MIFTKSNDGKKYSFFSHEPWNQTKLQKYEGR